MPRKGENIYKREDGRWEGRYIRSRASDGKAKYGYVYGKAYTEVKQKLLIAAATPRQHAENPPAVDATYDRLLDDWLRSARFNVKESTYARYTHLINTHIRPELGKLPLSQLTTLLMEDYIFHLLQIGRTDQRGGLSPKTVTDILNLIKSTLNYADCNDYGISCNLKRLTVRRTDKEMRVLTQTEQELLVRTLVDDMDLYKFGVLLSLYTGIRVGELCALKWEDICLAESVLRVRKTMQRIQETERGTLTKTKVVITEPKSKCSVREIPLPLFLVDIARQFSAPPQAFVLTGVPNRFVEPRTMQNRFKAYVAASGIEQANFHALRHTFATRCVEVGFELKSLSEILGHANVNITLNRYVHSSFELKCSNMNRLTLTL